MTRLMASLILRLLPLLLPLLPSGVWGATYYVDPVNGNNAWDGTSCTYVSGTTGPRLTANSGFTLVSNNDSLLLLPGTYAGAYFNANGTVTGVTIGGIVSCSDTAPNALAESLVVIASPAANHTFYGGGNSDGWTLKYLTLSPQGIKSGVYLDTGNDGSSLNYVTVKNAGSNFTGAGINLVGATNVLIDGVTVNLSMQDTAQTGSYIGASGVASGKIVKTQLLSDGIPCKNGFVNAGSGTFSVYNSNFSAGYDGVLQSGTGSTYIYNSVLSGGLYTYSNGVAAERTAGSLYLYTNDLLGSMYTPTTATRGTLAANTGNLVGVDPRYARPGHIGYVVIAFDDTAGVSYFQQAETMMASYGLTGTFYVQTNYDFHGNETWSAEDIATLQGFVSRGTLEIAAHTHSHSPMDVTSLGTLTYSGAGANPSYKIDLTNHQFLVKTDTVDTATIDLADDNSDTFASVLTAIRAATSNRWNITYSSDADGNETNGYVRISSLTAVDWTAVTSPIPLDRTDADCTDGACTGFYKDEIYDPKIKIETMVGAVTDPQTGVAYVCNSWAAPFTVGDTNSDQATRTAGFTSGRRSNSPQVLASTNMYQLQVVGAASWRGATEADTIQRIDQILARATHDGNYIQLLTHVTDSIPLTGDNSFETFLNRVKEWKDTGKVVVGSAQQIAAIITSSPWTYNSATGVTSRTFTDQSDLRPRPGPLVGTGMNVCTDTNVPITGCTATSMTGVLGYDGLSITNTDGTPCIGADCIMYKKRVF